TEAESVTVPSSVAWAVTVSVADAPAASVPTLNVTTPPDWVNVPWVVVAETYFRFAPRVSVTTTPVAELVASVLVTVTVYVTWSPSLAVGGPEVVTARSAGAPTMVPFCVAELLVEFGSAVVAATEAESLNAVPGGGAAGGVTTRVNVSELREAMSAAAVSVAVPPDWPKVNA